MKPGNSLHSQIQKANCHEIVHSMAGLFAAAKSKQDSAKKVKRNVNQHGNGELEDKKEHFHSLVLDQSSDARCVSSQGRREI